MAGDCQVPRSEFFFLIVLGEQFPNAALLSGSVIRMPLTGVKTIDMFLECGQWHQGQFRSARYLPPALRSNELHGRPFTLPLVHVTPSDRQRV